MMRALGSLLLALGAAALGAMSAQGVRRAGAELSDFETACARMAALLEFQRLPLPQLLRASAEGLSAPVRGFFDAAADLLGRDPACTCAQAFFRAPFPDGLPADARRALMSLAGSLGRTDADGQVRAITLCARQLGELSARFSSERAGRVRCRYALGFGAALVLTILLR